MFRFVLWIIYLYCFVKSEDTTSLIGYHCNTNTDPYTEVALTRIEPCSPLTLNKSTESGFLEVRQEKLFLPIQTWTCYMKIHQVIRYCGVASGLGYVKDGDVTFYHQFNRKECQDIIESRFIDYPYGDKRIRLPIKLGHSLQTNLIIVGSADSSSSCTRGSYYYNGVLYDNVIVAHNLELEVRKTTGKYYRLERQVEISPGKVCSYTDGSLGCTFRSQGTTFWQEINEITCNESYYDVLYRGPAQLFSPLNLDINRFMKVVMVNTTHRVFSLLLKELSPNNCFEEYQVTEYGSIVARFDTVKFWSTKSSLAQGLDVSLQALLGSRITYLEQSLSRQLELLYNSLIANECEIKTMQLRALHSLAYLNPDLFAFTYTGKPGYTALLSGDVIRVFQCSPTKVIVRRTLLCFSLLPVRSQKDNKDYFLTSRNNLLISMSDIVDCNEGFHYKYSLLNQWYQMGPNTSLLHTHDPVFLNPNLNRTWVYQPTYYQSTEGLYGKDYLKAYQGESFLYAERSMVLDKLSHTLVRNTPNPHTDIREGLIPMSLKTHITLWTTSIWSHFKSFGEVVAGLMGVYMCWKLCVSIINLIADGYALYNVFGWSFRLFAACFSSVANIMLLKRSPDTHINEDQQQNASSTQLNPQVIQNVSGNPSMTHDSRRLYPIIPILK